MKLSIIIINFNTPVLVYDCLKSIKRFASSTSLEVLVVENGSKEELRVKETEIKKIIENSKLIVSETNLGFGKGNNLGAKEASGEFLWLLNSDTLLCDDSPAKMTDFLEKHREVGALSPVLYHQNCDIQKNFFANFQTLGTVTFRRYNYRKIDFQKEYFYTDIVVGAALMIQREIFEKVGGFDENIFMYLEDDDLCKRIRNLGYNNAVLTGAKVIHLEGKSTKRLRDKKRLYYDSQTYYWKKHNGRFATLIMRILRWPYKFIRILS